MAIRPNTDPKSAVPRSGAPKGELEQYGVWVKAEPQDIVEEAAVASGDFDFDLPAEAPPLADESFLSADEEKFLGEVEAESAEEVSGDSAKAQGAEMPLSPLPSMDDIPGIEDSLLDAAPETGAEEVEELDSSTIDISLEELESAHSASPIHPGVEIDMSTVTGLEDEGEVHAPSPAMEDVSAEFLDAEPAGPSEDVTSQFVEAEAAPTPKAEEFESLDIDLHFDDTIPQKDDAASAAPLPGFEAVTEFDDFLAPGDGAAQSAQSFDDLAAVEQDLAASGEPSARPSEEPTAARADLSTEILLKIADELSSIRGELISLKTQLGDLRHEAEAERGLEPAPSFDKDEDAKAGGGFFDEEEDETIALTGDELDNILNTADFTEEVAEAEPPVEAETAAPIEDLAAPSAPSDMSLLSESILPETGDYASAPADTPIEEINLGGKAAAEEVVEAVEEPAQFEEISLMAEEGVLPMTEAPEDTSYLEGEAQEVGDLSLKDVPLVEPDLSSFEAEELEVEPVAEIEEELPLVEEAEAPAGDMTLDIDTVVEAEPVEQKLESDVSHLTGINLHEENLAPIPEIEDIAEVEELPEAEELSSLEEDIELKTVKPAEPVAIHPDEMPSSLDDQLFVEEAAAPIEEATVPPEPLAAQPQPAEASPAASDSDHLKSEIRSVLSYLDKLLDSLPEDKIEEFARSEHFDTYKRLFEELGLV
jgi:pilus assembly protein FimV